MMQQEICKMSRTIFEMTSEEVYAVLKNVPVVEPEPDELEALIRSHASQEEGVPFECIQWE